jgi:hypothetical protein
VVPDGVHLKPEILHFTIEAVVFRDGTTSMIDAVLLGTDYEIRKPFLDEGEVLLTDPTAQSLVVTHVILDPRILPSRNKLLEDHALQEERLRQKGYDFYRLGHQLPPVTTSDYQDDLIAFLKHKVCSSDNTQFRVDHSIVFVQRVLPNDGKKFVKVWRRDILGGYHYLRRGWEANRAPRGRD